MQEKEKPSEAHIKSLHIPPKDRFYHWMRASPFPPAPLLLLASTSRPDRIAFTDSNVISQRAEGTKAGPVLSETSYRTHIAITSSFLS